MPWSVFWHRLPNFETVCIEYGSYGRVEFTGLQIFRLESYSQILTVYWITERSFIHIKHDRDGVSRFKFRVRVFFSWAWEAMSQLAVVDAPAFFSVTKGYIILRALSAYSNFHQRPLVDFDLEKVLGAWFHSLNNRNDEIKNLSRKYLRCRL